MEIGGGSNPQVPRSGAIAMEGEGNAEGGVPNSSIPNPMEVTESGMMRNPEEYMPIANILRIMRRVLPPQAKVSDDAKETVQECLTEFISFVTGEANVRCHRECRKTITAEDLLAAMATLGFHDYVQPLTMYLNQYRAHNNLRSPAPPQRRFMGGRGGPGEGSSSAGHFGR